MSLSGLLGWAYGLALGAMVGCTVFVTAGVLGVALMWLTAPVIVVTDDTLRVGAAEVPRHVVSGVHVVSRDGVQKLRGPGSDARLYVELRPWSASRAVQVDLDDPSDPHPAWLFSSRNPEVIAAALVVTTGNGDLQEKRKTSSEDLTQGSWSKEDS